MKYIPCEMYVKCTCNVCEYFHMLCVSEIHSMYLKIHIPGKIIFCEKNKHISCKFIYMICVIIHTHFTWFALNSHTWNKIYTSCEYKKIQSSQVLHYLSKNKTVDVKCNQVVY